ncbi:Brix domain-containing protein F44G4.1 [Trichinella britovi]|uniref:Brix domain-containing protein F44G4.1 n=2 Tax=Trichinella britovi TaxID=45882 RepID=A0A0V1CQG7_TRIBR|nr:Brix domain-containing protein F44G4.1 [Trichinella britovi]
MSGKEKPVGGLKLVRAIRRERAKELRTIKSKEKRKRVAERRKLRATFGEDVCPVQQPKTLENTREYDETIVLPNDEEEVYEENTDEIAPYFHMKTKPKVLLTTSPKAKVVSWKLCYEFHRCIPNSHVIGRKGISLKRLISLANSKNYTDIVVVHEDRRSPNGLVLCHLPDGPTAYFKMQNVKLPKDIKNCGKGAVFGNPELVLNNFSTRLGHTVARMLACLFPQDPHFGGRRVVTFHNQRDYIFFRHHWFGYKVWLLCGNHGYPYHMITYQGKEIHALKLPLSTRFISNMVDIQKTPIPQGIRCILTTFSTIMSCWPLRNTQRRVKGQRIEVQMPNIVRSYNTVMGGVDLLDRLAAAYRPTIRSEKWYWPLFISAMNIATVAAWWIHCFVEERPHNDLELRRQVILSLLQSERTATPRVASGFMSQLPDIRFDGVNYIFGTGPQGCCKVCK